MIHGTILTRVRAISRNGTEDAGHWTCWGLVVLGRDAGCDGDGDEQR